MMISDSRKAANAMGGKTARACDSCLRKRARWYCAADDAFLCQSCDASVHSANQLASRHERVRLQTASSSSSSSSSASKFNNNQHHDAPPAWHQGFTRKARTPRQKHSNTMLGQTKVLDQGFKVVDSNSVFHPLVPELGSEEGSVEENEENLLCRVPVFDPFAAELSNDGDEVGVVISEGQVGTWENMDADGFNDLLQSDIDIDLAEFAADVESLLGVELDEETKPTESLDVGESNNCFQQHKVVRVKDEDEGITEACCFDSALRDSLNWSLDLGDEEEEEKGVVQATVDGESSKAEMKRKKMLLRLNYESVITAWTTQRSPWTTGSRPEFNPDDDFIMGNDEVGGAYGGRRNITDGEREARVSRYREKRRTRLFSKKIRYEVRKLNAEKRPRMKGRFVKRTSSTTSFLATNTMPPAFPNYNQLIR